jgi:hypothetical protein
MKKISDLSPEERRQLLRFNFLDGPLEDIDRAIPALGAFGLAVMSWARLEIHLDALLIHLNKRRFSKELFDEDHPVSFSRKLRLLKRWFRHKALAEYKPAIDKLSGQMKMLSARRNEYLHALLSAYDAKTDEITLRSIHYAGNDEFRIQLHTLNTKKLASFAAAATNTNRALAVISLALFTRDAIERLRTP